MSNNINNLSRGQFCGLALTIVGMLGFLTFIIVAGLDLGIDDSPGSILWIIGVAGLLLTLLGFFVPVLFKSDDNITDTRDAKLAHTQYLNYFKYNKKRLKPYERPIWGDSAVVLANKFLIVEFDVFCVDYYGSKIFITDKINCIRYSYNISLNGESGYSYRIYGFFVNLFEMIDYETVYDDIMNYINKSGIQCELGRMTELNKISLDINQASEAELTALPGVTIAKAKHAIKVRNRQKLFLTMNQFYEAINLEEEFIEQIQTKGNKVLLSELPEYKRLEKFDN